MAFDVGFDDSDRDSTAAVAAKIPTSGGDFDKELFYNLTAAAPPGKNHVFRMLPQTVTHPEKGKIHYYGGAGNRAMVVYDHWNVPGSEDNKEHARCISKTYPDRGAECPICKAMGKLYDWAKEQGLTDADKKSLGIGKGQSQYRLGSRAYVLGIIRGSDLTQEVEISGETIVIPKIRVIGMPPAKVYGWFMEQISARDPEDPNKYDLDPSPLHPVQGLDMKVNVKKGPKQTDLPEYSCSWRDGRRPIHPDEAVAKALCVSGKPLTEMFSFPDDEKIAHMRALADKILSLMGRQLQSRKGTSSSDDDSDVGTAAVSNGLVGGDGKPGCYTNHLPGDPKCLSCPYEVTCEDEDDTKKKPIEARRKVHAEIAAA